MQSLHSLILQPPAILKHEVECVRITEYCGNGAVAIKASPNGAPGLVFHQHNGHAALDQILTQSGRRFSPPLAFLYGPVIEPSVVKYPNPLEGDGLVRMPASPADEPQGKLRD